MITLKFRGQNEMVFFKLDRDKKIFLFASSKTGYKEQQLNWNRLFDSGKERVQRLITDKMDDTRFMHNVVYHMQQLGYVKVEQ